MKLGEVATLEKETSVIECKDDWSVSQSVVAVFYYSQKILAADVDPLKVVLIFKNEADNSIWVATESHFTVDTPLTRII